MSEPPFSPQANDQLVIRRRKALAGWVWLRRGWQLFAEAPAPWILMGFIFLMVSVLGLMIPVLNIVCFVLTPVLTGGAMLAAHRQHRNGVVAVSDLFEGFREARGALITLGFIILSAVLLLNLLIAALLGGEQLRVDAETGAVLMDRHLLVYTLLVLVMMMPVIMAQWFAPALIVLRDLRSWPAFKASFLACMANVAPFLVYGAFVSLLGFFSVITMGLGLLILIPLTLTSLYAAYLDVFIQPDPESKEADAGTTMTFLG